MTSDGYVTPKEAADILGVSEHTLRQMIDDGRIPAVQLGPRLTRIARADLTPEAIRARLEAMG